MTSNGFLLSANCEDIRSFKPIGINHIEPDGKTSITLVGDQLKPIFEANFGEIFAGFPVPVFINGLEIQRIHALIQVWFSTNLFLEKSVYQDSGSH